MAYGGKIQTSVKAVRSGGALADGSGAGLVHESGPAAGKDTIPAAPQRKHRADFTQRHLELPSDTAERARLEQGAAAKRQKSWHRRANPPGPGPRPAPDKTVAASHLKHPNLT